MEKLIRIVLVLFLSLLSCSMAMAQEPVKKKVAVYVSGEDATDQQKKVISSKVGNAFVKSGDYILVETSKEFLESLMKEVDRQASGEVRQNQIVALGNKYGVRYVVAIDITDFGEELYVVSRMINLETGIVGLSTDANGPGETVSQLNKLSQYIIAGLLKDSKTGSSQSGAYNAPNDGVEKYTVNGVTFEMVRVDGGTFMMGSYTGVYDEQPAHSETVSTFYIGKTEVTQALWGAVMGSNPSYFKGANLPVEQVSWNDCMEFIERLNRITGRKFRLPTEAEWEFAAIGGNKSSGYTYSGSNNLQSVGWYTDNSGSSTHAVGSKLDNELGLYDMSGNVWEWTSDLWSSNYNSYRNGGSSGSYRVSRGGSWFNDASHCRVAFRSYYTPSDRYDYLGFRLAL